MKHQRVKTIHHSNVLDAKEAAQSYKQLRDSIPWEEGIISRRTGLTRLGYSLNFGEHSLVDSLITKVFKKLALDNKYEIEGIYLNYYKDGHHHTPSHTHHGMTQLVISLGSTRTLKVASKDYPLNSGDVIIFGSSTHSVPIESSVTRGRISIATFMQPISLTIQSLTLAPSIFSYIQLNDEELIEMIKRASLMIQ
jgi:hypothetical protein